MSSSNLNQNDKIYKNWELNIKKFVSDFTFVPILDKEEVINDFDVNTNEQFSKIPKIDKKISEFLKWKGLH